MTVLMNKGPRTYGLKDGKDKEGNPVKRILPPGGSIEALDDEEAKHYLGYRDIVDAAKAVPAVTDKIKVLTEERDALKAKVADLEERLTKYEKDDHDGKVKGKK